MERGDLETSLGLVNSDSVTAESSASFWCYFLLRMLTQQKYMFEKS